MPNPLFSFFRSSDPKDLDHRLKSASLVLITMVVIAGGLYAIKAIWPILEWGLDILNPFLIAIVLAYIFNPVVNFIQKRLKLGRAMGLTVMAAIMVVILVLVLTLLAVLLLQLGQVFAEMSKTLPEKLSGWAADNPIAQLEWNKEEIAGFLSRMGERFGKVAAGVLPTLGQGSVTVAGGIATGIGLIFSFFSLIMFVTLITFYFLIDFYHIPRLVRILMPDEHEARLHGLVEKADAAVGGYLRGQITVCICVAVMTTILMLLVGPRKYALLIGCVAGAVNFIPYLGPVVGATPAVLWAIFAFNSFSDKAFHVGLIVGAFAMIQAADGLYFQPKIVGKSANLHPLAVLLALLIGARFGIGGMVAAVPLACVARVLMKELWWDKLAEEDRLGHPEEEEQRAKDEGRKKKRSEKKKAKRA